MTEARTLELLDQTHQFPCPYMFKVIGRVEGGFMARVVAAVRDELAHSADPPYKIRQSAGGRHVSITLEPMIQNSQEVLAVYRRLKRTDGLVMCW